MSSELKDVPGSIILGLPFTTMDFNQTLRRIEQMIHERSPNIVVTPNLDFLVNTMKDPVFKRIAYTADLITPDGMPIVWAAKLLKPRIKERIAGSDFVPLLLERAAQKGYSVFFLGGQEEVASQAAQNCKRQWPGLRIAGVYSPPFSTVWEMDRDAIVDRINSAAPDILLVGFGNPKQEKWMSMNLSRLNVPVSIGVGGTIDFLSGRMPRAPVWMKKLSAEWLFRLLLEPRRLARRYAIDILDGVIPLALQTLSSIMVRLIHWVTVRPGDEKIRTSQVTIDSQTPPVRALVVEDCTREQLEHFVLLLQGSMYSQIDALILDLRSMFGLDSETLSKITFIHKQLLEEGKRLILVTRKASSLSLRLARLLDVMTAVPSINEAIDSLRRAGRKLLTIEEHPIDRELRITSLRGVLTNHTAHLLDGLRPVLSRSEQIILDLTGMEAFDAGGIRRLIDLWKETRGTLENIHCIVNESQCLREFGSPGLRTQFVLHSSIEDAVRNRNGRPHKTSARRRLAIARTQPPN